jgi:hypothetical protein
MTRARFALLASTFVAAVVVAPAASAQSASIPVSANVQTPLTVTKNTNLDFTSVFPGVAKVVNSRTNGIASATAGYVSVQGQALAQVQVSFVFPSPLALNHATVAGATLPLTLGASSGCWGTTSTQGSCTYYDATTSLTQALSATGFMHVWLGGTVTPTANQTAGAYSANVTMNVAYTGL